MDNSIVKVEAKEDRVEVEIEPAQDLEVKVEPMDVEEQVSPFPIFRSFLNIPRTQTPSHPALAIPYCSRCSHEQD